MEDRKRDHAEAIAHLDFELTCTVGHPGGSDISPAGVPYAPCEHPPVYVSDLHHCPDQPTKIHYWCAGHLAEHVLNIMRIIRGAYDAGACSGCQGCGQHFHEVSDVIQNLAAIPHPE